MLQARQDNCVLASGAAPAIRPAGVACTTDESSRPDTDPRYASAHARAPRRVMRSFVPRPFPPPSLANVPVEYIIDQLHTLAPHYWSKPETADCSISACTPDHVALLPC